MNDSNSLSTLETRLGRLFTLGLVVSALFLTAGLIIYLAAPDSTAAGVPLSTGLMALMATPLLRVIVSIVEYVRRREWFFVWTTLAVLGQLTVTMVYAWLQP